ncbi:hypothetical protein P153DRAFT_392051 [Dothidotthia symphoricarpi CBS 119687]|uniref:Zn(2)-C6 fungal-type domain-containing protein n=1 Tax=Dothidotthia symphoricarpi CBS 119687 TaxID=1392245 RepID=A0A6A6AW22_9PLEO|nr:uncharacterized protein P153DRAFT_392051 [Dothidotthia symphoricarpi CBS 119687]KAF2134731.1 hypothetical protein P153DRAFT_392051 [Dothidotthia symphoricarpi CBS 119687]
MLRLDALECLHELCTPLALSIITIAPGMSQPSVRSMSPRPHSSNEQDRPSGNGEAVKRTNRLRSSCDACHRSKIKCTGGDPCSTCLGSQSRCTYSRGNRLGRPKGSKNKRTLMQDGGNENVKAQSETTKGSADVIQWPSTDLTSFEPDFDFNFETAFADNFADSRLLLDSHLGEMENLNSEDRMDASRFAQNYSTSDPSESLRYDSGGSGTDTVTTPPNYTTLPSPYRSSLASSKAGAPVTSIASGPSDCSCLQQLIKLLYHLQDLRCSHASGPAIDAVLIGVRLAEIPWKIVMHCGHCQNGDKHKEAYLLFSMSIRILLSSVQKLSSGLFQTEVTSNMAVSIGTFSLSGDAKSEVIEVAIRKALQAIAIALVHLWERTGRPRPTPTADMGMGNSALLTPMSLFASISDETQRLLACHDLTSALSGTENTMSLLNMLQFIMKVTEEELKTSTY